jgi:hypothetical protein
LNAIIPDSLNRSFEEKRKGRRMSKRLKCGNTRGSFHPQRPEDEVVASNVTTDQRNRIDSVRAQRKLRHEDNQRAKRVAAWMASQENGDATKSVAALNYEMTPTELANDRAMTEHVRARMGKDLDKGTVTDGVRCRVYVNGNRVP